jgi:hypothetical protein
MKCPRHKLKLTEVLFLYLELVFIFLYFTGTIIQLYFIFKINLDYLAATKFYYFFSIHNRINPKQYTASIKTLNHTVIESSGCPENTKQLSIMDLSHFKNITLKEVTNTTLIYENVIYPHLEHNTQNLFNTSQVINKKFYQFDLAILGEDELNLDTRYTFTYWKKKAFCALIVRFDNPKAIKLIDTDQNCVTNLKNPKTIDCGIYFNTYRLCLQYNMLRLNDTKLVSDVDIDISGLCPYSFIDINDNGFKLYKRKDIKQDELYKYNKYLLIDIDNVYLTNYQNITYPNETFLFREEELYNTYIVQDKYGYTDPFSLSIDSVGFRDLYNDTYYSNSIDGKPDPLVGDDSNSYYYITDNNNQVKANLNIFTYPLPSANCYKNVIKSHQYYLDLVGSLSTNFLTESINTIIAWLFVKLFISIYWQLQIRIHAILGKLRFRRLNLADRESDFITKLTGKLVVVIMFLILFYGILYQKKQFEKIIDTVDQLTKFCFKDQLVIDSLLTYSQLIVKLNESNRIIYLTLVISLGCEWVLVLYYLYEYFVVNKLKDD